MIKHNEKLPIVVLISGRGSNLQSIIDQAASGELPVDIRAVISNRPDAAGLERARAAGIETAVVDHRDYPGRETFDAALARCIDRYRPRVVVLAGFMRILTPGFVRHYRGRLLNIHPSLLPAYRGLNTHQRALADGARRHGASVHFVTEELDGGPVILQAKVPVHPDDTPETLAARVLAEEHRLYPAALRLLAEGRIRLDNGQALLDDRPLETPLQLDRLTAGAD
ncbi:phosphoribosylglycinamide formyltransferase [Thiohalobacter sp.]|uniref:phosphoribosylglycinamide formyltransferase n=1 Tax=Thiohalobacter sp. TaxID=2025948 RepID=UPI00260C5CC4|nr:phosphoribosylglycinamide formyltransferase [Thiohalobacter sp.]